MPFKRWLHAVFKHGDPSGGQPNPEATRPHEIFQASTLHALELGRYDGVVSAAELKRHGDTGLGAFDHLDGEMVMLEGEVYRVASNGAVHFAGNRETLAYALVTLFETDHVLDLRSVDSMRSLARALSEALPDPAAFHALRVRGRFQELRLRSPKPAEKPYPKLEEALKDQAEFRLADIEATLVGFYSPETAQGLDPAGFHFHCLSRDLAHGGHVVELKANELRAELDATPRLQLRLT